VLSKTTSITAVGIFHFGYVVYFWRFRRLFLVSLVLRVVFSLGLLYAWLENKLTHSGPMNYACFFGLGVFEKLYAFCKKCILKIILCIL